MRTILALATLAALSLTGCDASSEPTASPTHAADSPRPHNAIAPKPTADPRASLPEWQIEDLFTDMIQDSYPAAFGGVSQSSLVDLGKSICSNFDAGISFAEMVTVGIDTGYTGREVGGLIGAATAAFCPEHGDEVG